MTFRWEAEVDGVVVTLVHCIQSGTVALQLEDGQLRKLIWGQSSPYSSVLFALDYFNIYTPFPLVVCCFSIVLESLADSSEPSVEMWRDSSGCVVNLPVPCTQVSLCSISGEVRKSQS